MSKVIIPAQSLVHFWEAKLQYDRFLMEPSTIVMITATIKELRKAVLLEAKK